MSSEAKNEHQQKPENKSISPNTPCVNTTNQSNSDSSKTQTEFFDALSDPNKPKKSSFQITKIIVKDDDKKEESQDDLDETTNTEDLSLDASRTGDVEHEPSSASTVHSPGGTDDAVWSSLVHSIGEIPANVTRTPTTTTATTSKDKTQDTHSRFKVVKIESQDRLKRGRWTCTTFSDPNDMTDKTSVGGVQQSQTDSIYYIPPATEDPRGAVFAPIVYDEGHPVLKTNPNYTQLYVVSDKSKTQYLIGSVPSTEDDNDTNRASGNDENQFYSPDNPASSTISNKELERLQPPPPSLEQPLGSPLLDVNRLAGKRAGGLSSNSPLMAMVNATISSSSFSDLEDGGTSSVAIDNKIEQAMDLVKSHLMFAVREEVEVLKEQIKDLLEKNTQLEYENKILKEEASPDTLAKLRSIQS